MSVLAQAWVRMRAAALRARVSMRTRALDSITVHIHPPTCSDRQRTSCAQRPHVIPRDASVGSSERPQRANTTSWAASCNTARHTCCSPAMPHRGNRVRRAGDAARRDLHHPVRLGGVGGPEGVLHAQHLESLGQVAPHLPCPRQLATGQRAHALLRACPCMGCNVPCIVCRAANCVASCCTVSCAACT